MSEQDRKRWDERYLNDPGSTEPTPILERYWPLAPLGRAVDIACGNGRNSFFLAEKGFMVDAVDISTVATERLVGRHPNIRVHCQDLDAWTMPAEHYSLVLNVRFLDRRLFPMILKGLKPGGVLIFEAFIGREKADYCLAFNEPLRAFDALRIIYYAEKKLEGRHANKFEQIASMVAIKGDG